jgi:hypothetical protein
MGWMSWQRYGCAVDGCVNGTQAHGGCINEKLYMNQTDRLVADGYLAAGYNSINIDDCWEGAKRDADDVLHADPVRFPSGMKALGKYMHDRGVRFGIYSDVGEETCSDFSASGASSTHGDYFKVDADTYADWGVDYLKLDGCHNKNNTILATGYPAFGAALQASGRNITYSCSWPAYLGKNESAKPFEAMIAAGCNGWRNWEDISNDWGTVQEIMDHFGDYSPYLQKFAGPGAYR